jgi:hypothetical protein
MLRRNGCLPPIYGIVIAHVVVFGVAFGVGATAGAGDIVHPGDVFYGFQGGMVAMAKVLFTYIVSLGIVPLVISAVGAGMGVWVWERIVAPRGEILPPNQPTTNDSPAEPDAAADRLRD